MTIEIRNFGPIDYLKFDLQKDLHLIYGKNAIGKSYATYCLYCLIKNIKNKAAVDSWVFNDSLNNKHLTTFSKKIIENFPFTNTKPFVQELILFIEQELKNILLIGLENSLSNSFSSLTNLKNGYSKENFEIVISISDNERLSIFFTSESKLDLRYIPEANKLELMVNEEIPKLFSQTNKKVHVGSDKEEIHYELSSLLATEVNDILKKIDFEIRDVYYLPASRSGLYQALNSFTPIIAELTQNRFFLQNKRIELPTLPEPLSDYFIDLSTIDIQHQNKEFELIISELHEQILQGEVAYNDKTKRIIYKPEGVDIELNLSEASSMVAELSPLVLYFKHIINHKYGQKQNSDDIFSDLFSITQKKEIEKPNYYDILFIEEPEAHLHPDIQVKLMEVFAKLTKLNLKIVITSHSDYMFNKINNLLIKKELKDDKVMVYHLVKKSNGTVAIDDMKVTSEGIDDNNFQDITEQLYNERFSYLESHVDQ